MIAIYGKTFKKENSPFAQELFDYLNKKKMPYVVEENLLKLLKDELSVSVNAPSFKDFAEVRKETDVLFSMGGDGTILDAVLMVGDSNIPILGINFGRLGFLANIGRDKIHAAVDAVERGNYMIDKRSLLTLESNKPLFNNSFALNEMTIQRKDQSSMITVHTYLNGEWLNSYWADGLIISTPTGSTGYSLSCGGPIMYPTSNNFVITPVAPHNLNVRPMVVSDEVVLSFEVTGRGDSFLCTLDSRFRTIDSSYSLAIRKAPFTANFIRLNDQDFISALKNKLHWGADERNV